MILNLMRVEGISPEYMLERCFFQFPERRLGACARGGAEGAEEQRDLIKVEREEEVAEYYDVKHQLETLRRTCRR